MQIERVNIEDVFPVEDEFGNLYLSRDYSLPANRKYIEELAASFDASGEPNEPPVLVRDGGIYRVKAGNSRIEAMKLLGTKSFNAIIDENDTPQSLVEAAIRTDTKKRYEEIERSRFEQQLYLFADDEYVSETTGRSIEEVKKVRRTIENVEDAAEDMTIERMIALADFEDDTEAYHEICHASEKEWRRIAEHHQRAKAARERMQTLKETLHARNIPIVDEKPEGYRHNGWTSSASDIPEEITEGTMFLLRDGDNYGWLISPTVEEVDPEEDARQAELEKHKAQFKEVQERRLAWFLKHWQDDLPALVECGDADMIFGAEVREFLDDNDLTLTCDPAVNIETFVAFNRCAPYEGTWLSNPEEYVTFTDVLKQCGYEPDETENELYELAQSNIEEEE